MKFQDFLDFANEAGVQPDTEIYFVKDETQELHYFTASIYDKSQNMILTFGIGSGTLARPVGQGNSTDPFQLN